MSAPAGGDAVPVGGGPSTPPALELAKVTAGYGRTTVVRGVTVAVPRGSVVALLGPNGAGKTTLLRVAAGLLRPSHGEVHLAGEDVTRRRPWERARRGLALVPEGRGIFPNLTVRENLLLQAPASAQDDAVDAALTAFPRLRDRLGQRAGSMSGGEQQMLALSRCFVASPHVVLADEVSMGLAPRVIDEIFAAIDGLRSRGVALLIVEQYVGRALAIADHVYVVGKGEIEAVGAPADFDEAELARRYVGGGS